MDKFAEFSQLFNVDKLPTVRKRELEELASFLEIYGEYIGEHFLYLLRFIH